MELIINGSSITGIPVIPRTDTDISIFHKFFILVSRVHISTETHVRYSWFTKGVVIIYGRGAVEKGGT